MGRRGPPSGITAAQREELVALLTAGAGQEDSRQAVGVSRTAVRRLAALAREFVPQERWPEYAEAVNWEVAAAERRKRTWGRRAGVAPAGSGKVDAGACD
jgi:hypothetical protein